MKKLFLAFCIISILIFVGCAASNNQIDQNPLAVISSELDQYVEILAVDWPKASAAVRELIGINNLPKDIVDQMDRIDTFYKHKDGTWLSKEERKALPDYIKWSAAMARFRQTGPVFRDLVRQYAPGLLTVPEVISVLSFMGLGAL